MRFLRASDSGDPVDMLEARTASRRAETLQQQSRQLSADNSDFARNSEGRMIIQGRGQPKRVIASL